jgi:glycosyltransferase involved in cell wall biosynthesis
MPFAKEKIILIHNGIKEPKFLSKEAAREEILARNNLSPEQMPEKALWIGTIGELHKNKGHAYAIDALSKIPRNANVLFFIIGAGEEKATLLQKISECRLEKKVFLLGKMDNASDIVGAFDVFLFPSVKEGLPFAILEAGMAGIPMIASAVGGIPEVITDMETGILIRPKSSEEIIQAVEYIINHPIQAENFGKKLRAMIKKDFSLAKMLRETKEVYDD